MLKIFKKLIGVILVMSGLYAPGMLADASILLQSSNMLLSNGQSCYLYFTVTNATNVAIPNVITAVSIPAGCTVNYTGVPAGSTYSPAAVPGGAPGTWTIASLPANSTRQLILRFAYMGATGITITPSGTLTNGGSTSSSVNIAVVANTLLVEASKTVMGNNELNSVYVTVTNSTGAAIANVVTQVTIPAGFLANPITATPSAGTYTPPVNPSQIGTWTIPSLAANSAQTLVLKVTYTGPSGSIITPSAVLTSGLVGSSSIDILVGCPFLSWSASNTPVTLNNGNDVNFSSAGTTSYSVNFAAQGVPAVFNGRLQDIGGGSPAYTARFQNSTSAGMNGDIAPVLTFNNAYTGGASGNAPYTMVFPNPQTGFLNPAAPVTINPPNYLEGQFVFDPAIYPNGLYGISFFIYDIDASPTNGWQDAVIVFGTDMSNNTVAPVRQYSVITTLYDVPVPGNSYGINIGGNNPSLNYTANLVNYAQDNPRGRVTYKFPSPIKDFSIRYFRNSQINSAHVIWLSNLYRGCGSDLQLRLDAPINTDCDQCFTYTVTAHNAGPSDVSTAQVTNVVPAGLTVQTYTASKGTFDPILGVWTFDSFKNGDTETLIVNACAGLDTVATFSMVLLGDGDQSVPGDNIATHVTNITYVNAQDSGAVTGQGIPVNVDWASNDYSVGGTLDLGSFAFTPPPASEGTVSIFMPGVVTFTPNPTFIGTSIIPYTVSDSNGCSDGANIWVTINGAPIATDKYATTIPVTLVNVDLTVGDTYAVGSTFSLNTPASNGTAVVNPDGSSTYTPAPGFCGNDSYTYLITQPDSQTDSATVYINVICPPIAVDNSGVTTPSVPVNINVATNDTYISPSTFALVTGATNGVAVVNPDGTTTYTPNNGFCGTDSFTYNITQQPASPYEQISNTATVTINVVCGTPPLSYNDAGVTPINTPIVMNVLLNDIAGSYPLNPASVQVVTNPSNGTTSVNPATGAVTYTPNPFFIGADSYVYQVCDTSPAPQCISAIGYVTVTPLNRPCPTVCSTDCCANPCFDQVNECMCTQASFARFTSVSGTWSLVSNLTHTSAGLNAWNYLRFNTPISQTNQILEFEIEFPTQLLQEQFTSAGIVTNWNGVPADGEKVVYLSFDNRTGTPVGSKLAIGGLNQSEVIFPLPFEFVLGQTYTIRLEKSLQLTNVYIDNVLRGWSSAGNVTGNLIGFWAFQATANFSELSSCSYPLTPPNFIRMP